MLGFVGAVKFTTPVLGFPQSIPALQRSQVSGEDKMNRMDRIEKNGCLEVSDFYFCQRGPRKRKRFSVERTEKPQGFTTGPFG